MIVTWFSQLCCQVLMKVSVHLVQALLRDSSTHKICFGWEIKKYHFNLEACKNKVHIHKEMLYIPHFPRLVRKQAFLQTIIYCQYSCESSYEEISNEHDSSTVSWRKWEKNHIFWQKNASLSIKDFSSVVVSSLSIEAVRQLSAPHHYLLMRIQNILFLTYKHLPNHSLIKY